MSNWPPGWTNELIEEFGTVTWFEHARPGERIKLMTSKRGRVFTCHGCWPRPCDHKSSKEEP